MAARTLTSENLLSKTQKEEILRVTDKRGVIIICNQIPGEIKERENHRKFFCKNAHITAAKYFSVLPQDYQEALMDYVLRTHTLTDMYFRYNEDFFLNCLVRLFSKTRFNRKKFIDEMFLFLSDESTVALLDQAEKLTTDTKALKRMKKIKECYSISVHFNEEEEE